MTGTACIDAEAYVLGALSAAERHDFEQHLAGCPGCRRTVAELAGVPGLLARVSPADLAAPAPAPDTLLPRLIGEVTRRRRVRRLAAVATGVVAAAVVVALTLALGPADPQPSGRAMHRLVSAPITATAALRPEDGGTRVDLTCRYAGPTRGLPAYRLVVTDVRGHEHAVATWRVGPDGTTRVVGSVGLKPGQIRRVEVRTASGTPVLSLAG